MTMKNSDARGSFLRIYVNDTKLFLIKLISEDFNPNQGPILLTFFASPVRFLENFFISNKNVCYTYQLLRTPELGSH